MADTPEQVVSKCIQDFEEDCKPHEEWERNADRWYKAWRGVVDRASDAAQWENQLYPPYLLQIVETLAAGVIDPNPRWRVKPRARQTSLDEIEFVAEGARALEALLAYQRDRDGFVGKQRTHRLQGLITGLTGWKPYWDLDADEPCVEVVDMRDLIWHQSATSVERAQRITHRVWKSIDDLRDLQKAGVYKNVDKLGETRSFSDAMASREQDLFNADRTKDLIEVLECWVDGGKRVVTLANRTVLLSDRKNPYDHGKYPFVLSAPIPDLFRIPGLSVVELVEALQQMLWKLQNRRLDNLDLVANAIMLVRDDVQDLNAITFEPGAQWLVPDKDAITVWQPDTRSAQVSLDAEALIKADIQNIPGASPALLGQTDATEQTATEVSLLTNLAQRRLAAMKYQYTLADVAVAEHWLELNKQYISEERYIGIVGQDGEEGYELISPEDLDYNWRIDIDQMDESLVRQEKRAEAQAKLQVFLSAVPVFAAVGVPLNVKAAMEDFLDAFGVQDRERYFSAQPQPPMPQPGQAPGPPVPGEEGATAPQAVDANSPSNQFSQSPVAMMQRALASSGGEVNL